jgi:hypothetical protein
MKRAYFVCLFYLLTSTFLLAQLNSVLPVNPAPRVVSPSGASQANLKDQAKLLDGNRPDSFETNQGKTDVQVAFLSPRLGGTIGAGKSEPQFDRSCRTTTKAIVYGNLYVTQTVTIWGVVNMLENCDDQYFNPYFCSGIVAFYDYQAGEKSFLGTGSPANGDGCTQTFGTSSLTAGNHVIVAEFEGNEDYSGSSGNVTIEIAKWPITTTITSTPNPSAYGQDVTFTVTPAGGVEDPLTGKVRISNGTVPFGTATLDGNGIATFDVKNLPVGTDAITAEYLGDSLSAKSTSAVLNQVVTACSQ